MDLGQINAEDTKQRGPNIKRRRTDLLGICTRAWQWTGIMVGICAQCRKRRLNMAITFQHLGLVEVIEFERLGQREDVFGAIIPIERSFDCLC
ncbi:hypothetical protein [Celeribacter baekdonensis]|uniref:hypothetical protein n=1 Tax=Celeribacter baekdonensis TaxID=875171 RepID=UPI003A934B3F